MLHAALICIHHDEMRNLDLDQVRAFTLVAELKSFTAAGEALGATQSAISLRIGKLEAQLGKRLLARSPRSVALTGDGTHFLPHARQIIATHDEALARMDGTERALKPLRLAVSDHAAGGHLVAALRGLRAALPGYAPDVVVGLSAEMRAAYDAGEADAAIVRQDADRRDGTPLFRDPLLWVASESRRTVLREAPLDLVVLRGPCGVKAAMIRALDSAGVPWRLAFQGGSVMAIQAAVAAGLGVSAFGRAHVPAGCTVVTDLPALPNGKVVMHARLPASLRGAIANAFRRREAAL
jgi:DNA-binding transcriptional LysR family regulator